MSPIGTTPLTRMAGVLDADHRYVLQAMVSSVGPYRFSMTLLGAARFHASASVPSSGSPQNRLHRRLGRLPAVSIPRRATSWIALGTENQNVSPWAATNAG